MSHEIVASSNPHELRPHIQKSVDQSKKMLRMAIEQLSAGKILQMLNTSIVTLNESDSDQNKVYWGPEDVKHLCVIAGLGQEWLNATIDPN